MTDRKRKMKAKCESGVIFTKVEIRSFLRLYQLYYFLKKRIMFSILSGFLSVKIKVTKFEDVMLLNFNEYRFIYLYYLFRLKLLY